MCAENGRRAHIVRCLRVAEHPVELRNEVGRDARLGQDHLHRDVARACTSAVQCAVSPMIGMLRVRESARSAAASSNPFMPGSVISVTTAAGGL